MSSQAITLLAQRARLQSEQLGRNTIVMPAEFAAMTAPEDRAEIARAMQVQGVQLRTRLAVVQAQRGAFAQRRSGAGNLGRGYSEQVAAHRAADPLARSGTRQACAGSPRKASFRKAGSARSSAPGPN